MRMMKRSGYNEKFRREVLRSGRLAFQKILQENQMGTKPIYRSRKWKELERAKEKIQKRKNW